MGKLWCPDILLSGKKLFFLYWCSSSGEWDSPWKGGGYYQQWADSSSEYLRGNGCGMYYVCIFCIIPERRILIL